MLRRFRLMLNGNLSTSKADAGELPLPLYRIQNPHSNGVIVMQDGLFGDNCKHSILEIKQPLHTPIIGIFCVALTWTKLEWTPIGVHTSRPIYIPNVSFINLEKVGSVIQTPLFSTSIRNSSYVGCCIPINYTLIMAVVSADGNQLLAWITKDFEKWKYSQSCSFWLLWSIPVALNRLRMALECYCCKNKTTTKNAKRHIWQATTSFELPQKRQ